MRYYLTLSNVNQVQNSFSFCYEITLQKFRISWINLEKMLIVLLNFSMNKATFFIYIKLAFSCTFKDL